MKKDGSEKRLFPRKLMKTKVVFEDEFGDGMICAYADDISLGGLFLLSDIPLKVGSYIFISFFLPDSSIEVRSTGQIVRVTRESTKDGGASQGMGVRFVGLTGDTARAIQDYVG